MRVWCNGSTINVQLVGEVQIYLLAQSIFMVKHNSFIFLFKGYTYLYLPDFFLLGILSQ